MGIAAIVHTLYMKLAVLLSTFSKKDGVKNNSNNIAAKDFIFLASLSAFDETVVYAPEVVAQISR